jgi:hypothetical protein
VFETAARLFADPSARERLQACAQAFVAGHRGAVDRLWRWLEPRIAEADQLGTSVGRYNG